MLQITQQIRQLLRQLMRIAILHVVLDGYHTQRAMGRGEANHQARLICAAPQGIVPQVERLGLDAAGITQVNIHRLPVSFGWMHLLQLCRGRECAVNADIGQSEAQA